MLVKLSRPATVEKYGYSPAGTVVDVGHASAVTLLLDGAAALDDESRALAANLPVPVAPAAGPFLSKYDPQALSDALQKRYAVGDHAPLLLGEISARLQLLIDGQQRLTEAVERLAAPTKP